MKKLPLLLLLAFPTCSTFAVETRPVYGPDGNLVFNVRFFGTKDGFYAIDEGKPLKSTWDMDNRRKAQLMAPLGYWAELLSRVPGQVPAVINVGTMEDDNAQANFGTATAAPLSHSQLQAALIGKNPGTPQFGSHAQITIGKMDFDAAPFQPSQLPRGQKNDLGAIMFHEIGHALGIGSAIRPARTPAIVRFGSTLTPWDTHLRDDNGRPASPGQAVLCSSGCGNGDESTGFDIRKGTAYFTGSNVDEVLAGSMRGVPVQNPREYDLSHIELKNGNMSHADYRNYTNFMEVELAMLQDMGYTIDRRNFFGSSVYGSNLDIASVNGFYKRNEAGTAYLPGQYNTSTLGLGLHVYGSNNRISQQADLLAKGAGGAGIRIDGEANRLTVEKGVRVHADGLNGRGVMFAYGKNHELIQRGEVQALGENGIAASFDFGNNGVGNQDEYRGSHIYSTGGEAKPVLDELNGALVDRFDLSGRLAGKEAAIYISSNALVNQINVMRGAQIEGKITSKYAEKDEHGEQRLTHLSFGRVADGDGRATDQADNGFVLRHDSDIQGINNLALGAKGGKTSLNGNHQLYRVEVAPAATLGGDSTYLINADGAFVNNGTVAPGNSIGTMEVTGTYRQSATGNLLMEFNGQAQDQLLVFGRAELDGKLTLAPQRDWYASGTRTASLVEAMSVSGAFTQIDSPAVSPTLSFKAAPSGNAYRLTVARGVNAYSRYATDSNSREVGKALDRAAEQARADLRPLYAALDFSAMNGSALNGAMRQLSPSAYSATLSAALDRERQLTSILGNAAGGTARNAFALPFGGSARQNGQHGIAGHDSKTQGMLFGAETPVPDSDIVAGVHGAISTQSVDARTADGASARTTAFALGAHARYVPDAKAGMHLFGQARAGWEQAEIDRRVSVNGYQAKSHGEWTGRAISIQAGGGYRLALSDSLSVGPVTSLAYTSVTRPEVTESGSGPKLKLASATASSLLLRAGMAGALDMPLEDGARLGADLQLNWGHELLKDALVQEASFAGYGNTDFRTYTQTGGRNLMELKTGVTYKLNDRMSFGAGLSTDLLRTGYRSIAGNAFASVKF